MPCSILSPGSRCWLPRVSAGNVSVRRRGGSAGAFTATTQRFVSSRAGDPGNSDAVCPSSPSPRRTRSKRGQSSGEIVPQRLLVVSSSYVGIRQFRRHRMHIRQPDTERDPAKSPSPCGSYFVDRRAARNARLPRKRALLSMGSGLETAKKASGRGFAACSHPRAQGNIVPLVCTESLIVLTAASAARRLSSFTSANTRTSDFISPRSLVPKVRTVPALHNIRPLMLRDTTIG